MTTPVETARRVAGAAAIEDLLEMMAINPHERAATSPNGEAEGDTIAEILADTVLKAADKAKPPRSTALTATEYTNRRRYPRFTTRVGERARDIRTGETGVVHALHRARPDTAWLADIKRDSDGLLAQYHALDLVAPKGGA